MSFFGWLDHHAVNQVKLVATNLHVNAVQPSNPTKSVCPCWPILKPVKGEIITRTPDSTD